MTDNRQSEKLTLAFSSGVELKTLNNWLQWVLTTHNSLSGEQNGVKNRPSTSCVLANPIKVLESHASITILYTSSTK
jgi:hypothetical protein